MDIHKSMEIGRHIYKRVDIHPLMEIQVPRISTVGCPFMVIPGYPYGYPNTRMDN